MDSVARNTLLVLRNKRTALDENDTKVPAIKWLANLLFAPERADELKTFLIDHDQVLGLIGKKLVQDGKHFLTVTWNLLSKVKPTAQEAGKVEGSFVTTSSKTSLNCTTSGSIPKPQDYPCSPSARPILFCTRPCKPGTTFLRFRKG